MASATRGAAAAAAVGSSSGSGTGSGASKTVLAGAVAGGGAGAVSRAASMFRTWLHAAVLLLAANTASGAQVPQSSTVAARSLLPAVATAEGTADVAVACCEALAELDRACMRGAGSSLSWVA